MKQIRLATFADIDECASLQNEVQEQHRLAKPDLFKQMVPDQYRDYLKHHLSVDTSKVVVAISEGAIVGYAVIEIRNRAENPYSYGLKAAYLDQISVSSSRRGKGHGQALIAEAKKLAQIEGFRQLELDVWDFNAPARKFFELQGFKTYNYKMSCGLEQ